MLNSNTAKTIGADDMPLIKVLTVWPTSSTAPGLILSCSWATLIVLSAGAKPRDHLVDLALVLGREPQFLLPQIVDEVQQRHDHNRKREREGLAAHRTKKFASCPRTHWLGGSCRGAWPLVIATARAAIADGSRSHARKGPGRSPRCSCLCTSALRSCCREFQNSTNSCRGWAARAPDRETRRPYRQP